MRMSALTTTFRDADLEREYISASVQVSAKKMKAIFLYVASFFFLLTLIEAVVVSPVGHSSVAGNGLVLVCIAFLCAHHKLPKSKWYWMGNNSERVMVSLGIIVSISLALGHSTATYYDSAHYTGKTLRPPPPLQQQQDSDLSSTNESSRGVMSSELGFYYFMNGFWPVFFYQLYMHFDVVRFLAFAGLVGVVVLCHATRTILVNPVPGDMRLMWVLINYIALPGFFLLLARSNELQRRQGFLFNRSIQMKRRRRNAVVHDAEALAGSFCKFPVVIFEKPTDEERVVVANTFDAPEMAWLVTYQVWFEDIVFHTRIGNGQFGEAILSSFHGGRCVAKRMLRKSIDEDSLRFVVNEARAVANLRHPNVVQFLGVSWDNVANILLLFEYVPRGDMTGVLRDNQVFLSWDDPKMGMAIDVARGLGYLKHRHNSPAIVHGDLKPDNVLVTNTFGCKLSDFGSAKKLGESNNHSMMTTTSSRFFGTALYMAPEIFLGGAYSTAVDVFSFGILLWELQSHVRPYEDLHVEAEELLQKTAGEQLRPPVDPTMPSGLRAIMQRCWAHDPDERPDISDVVAELEELQRAEREMQDYRRELSQARHGYPGGWHSSSLSAEEEEKTNSTQSHCCGGAGIHAGGVDGGEDVECETVQEEVSGARLMLAASSSSRSSSSCCWRGGGGGGGGDSDGGGGCGEVDVVELNSSTLLGNVGGDGELSQMMNNAPTAQFYHLSTPADRRGLSPSAPPNSEEGGKATGESPTAQLQYSSSLVKSHHHLATSDRRGLLTTGCCLMTPSAPPAGADSRDNTNNVLVYAAAASNDVSKNKKTGQPEART